MDNMKDKENICIVTLPVTKTGFVPFSQIVKISGELSNELYLISGGQASEILEKNNKIHFHEIFHRKRYNTLSRALAYTKLQFSISYKIFKLREEIDPIIFFIGGEGLILPSITAKLLNKELIIVLAGDPSKQGILKGDPLKRVTNFLSNMVLRLSDKIVIYSDIIMDERNLHHLSNKVHVAHRHVLDFDKFNILKPINKRENLIGYIGTFNELKGVKNLIDAINILLGDNNDFRFIFIGDGPLRSQIEVWVNDNDLDEKVMIHSWVDHDDLPDYLNELKLLVLPSLTEGLPNILLEAMACGTPVLTTPVGAIPDVIIDGENGFLLTDNKPDNIAWSIERCIDNYSLDKIAENGFKLVNKKYNFQEVKNNWQKILIN